MQLRPASLGSPSGVFCDMAKAKDIVPQLLDAADEIDSMRRADLQVLLRRAADDIETLRKLVGIRDEVWLEDEPPAGNG